MKKIISKTVALATITSITTGLMGCSSIVHTDVTKYSLEPYLTTQEAVDYYTESLKYDSVISKNVEVHKTNYELKDIKGEKAERLKALTSKVEAILGQDKYEVTEENLKLISPDNFNYIKGFLDNEVLTKGKVENIQGALGYYFVDVSYEVGPKKTGTFNDLTALVGLNGAFVKNYDDTYSLNDAYLQSVVKELNKYYFKNNIIKCAVLNGTKLEVQEGVAPIVDNITAATESDDSTLFNTGENLDGLQGVDANIGGESVDPSILNTEQAGQTENAEQAGQEGDTTASIGNNKTVAKEETIISLDQVRMSNANTEEVETIEKTEKKSKKETKVKKDNEEQKIYGSVTPDNRKIKLDGNEINRIAGTSVRDIATMPDLETVYTLPPKEGDISGYGIYTAGGNGAKIFGFNRDELKGKLTLRFVFKDDSDGTGEILGTNVYCIEEEINTGINISDNSVLVPDFLYSELEQVIERVDRVQVNDDLAGILSGHLYEDLGVGILRGYKEDSTGITKNMSKIVQVIGRDTANNAYALDVETTVIEGAKDVDCYGTYKDKYLYIVQQQGTEFKVVDHVRLSRELAAEPPINPDSTTKKRLIALNLAGEIPEESKESIKGLMSTIYTGATNRIGHGPLDVKVDGKTVTIEKGALDCFQKDTKILSTDNYEYITSKLVNIMNKFGSDKQIMYNGTVSEWIGGYENQAEFTTEELVTYEGTDKAYYMNVYYLVSCLNDEWVIDERTIMDEYEVDNATELQNIKDRISQ